MSDHTKLQSHMECISHRDSADSVTVVLQTSTGINISTNSVYCSLQWLYTLSRVPTAFFFRKVILFNVLWALQMRYFQTTLNHFPPKHGSRKHYIVDEIWKRWPTVAFPNENNGTLFPFGWGHRSETTGMAWCHKESVKAVSGIFMVILCKAFLGKVLLVESNFNPELVSVTQVNEKGGSASFCSTF